MSASRSPSQQFSLRSHSSVRRGSRHGSEQNVSRGSSGHSPRRCSIRSNSSKRAMCDHRGRGRSASESPSQRSLRVCSRPPSRSRSRSHSSEPIRNEHNETNINNEHNEVHNNHEHRESHDSHNDPRAISAANMNNTYMTLQDVVGFTDPISPYRSNRNAQHQNNCYPEDKLFPGLLSYPSASRTSMNPYRSSRRDDYYPSNRSGYYERRQRSGLNLPDPGSADIGALCLAAGALGGFLSGNALNNNNSRRVERPAPSAPRPSTGNYTNYSERPYVSRYSQEEAREDIGRREQRRRNAPVDGRSWLVDERRSVNRDSGRSNRDSRPSEKDSGMPNRDMKPPAERSDWDYYRPLTSSTGNTPPIRYQGDSIDLGRGFAHDKTYATSHPVGGPAREYRANGTIKEAGVKPYDTPKPPEHPSGSKSKRESKSYKKKKSSSSEMSGGYGIPLDRLIAPSGVIPEPSGRIPAHIKSGRAVNPGRSGARMPAAPAYGGSGVGIDRLETWQDYMDPQGRVTAGVGGIGGMDGMGGRMPKGVRLEKWPSRIGAFMGKLCGSARA